MYSSLFLVAIAAVLIYTNRDVLIDTFHSINDVSLLSLVLLGIIAVALIFARGALVATTIPGLSIKRAALADQVALSAAYSIAFGGGSVGVAAKVAMFQAWQVRSAAIGASLVATAVIPTFTTWLPPILVHTPMMFTGSASRIEVLAVIVGVATVAFNLVFWAGVLYLNGPIHRIASLSQWIQKVILWIVPSRWARVSNAIHSFDIKTFVHSTRGDLRELLSKRRVHMFGAALLVTLMSFSAFLVSLRAFNAENISIIEALSAFALVRVVIALSPLPGGVGLAEVSLVAMLTSAGANDVQAVGATLLYRSVVWLVPIIVGGIGWWLWSRRFYSSIKGMPSVSSSPELGRGAD